MTLRPAFGLGHSEYNPFLFAVVGEGDRGLPITVLSALTRLGIDPWEEAARLSDLPREVAARALAETISALPRQDPQAPDSEALAARLVNWLPARSAPVIPAVPAAERIEPRRMAPETAKSRLAIALPWLALAVAALVLFLYLQADNNLEPATPAGGQSEHYNR
jgi:hypothetical protein